MFRVQSISGLFKWRQFEPEVILLAVGWYLRFSLSYRDVEELLARAGPARRSRHGLEGAALRPGNGTTFALEAQTDQRQLAVASLVMICPALAQQAPASPPPPPLPAAQQPVPPSPPPAGAAQVTTIRGTVSQYMMNPDGLVDGLLLNDNTIVRFPAHGSAVGQGR